MIVINSFMAIITKYVYETVWFVFINKYSDLSNFICFNMWFDTH